MDIVEIENLKNGDIILIEDIDESCCQVVTVDRVTDDNLIITVEDGGLEYVPEDPGSIVRLGSKKVKPTIIVRAKCISLGLSDFWQDMFKIKK